MRVELTVEQFAALVQQFIRYTDKHRDWDTNIQIFNEGDVVALAFEYPSFGDVIRIQADGDTVAHSHEEYAD